MEENKNEKITEEAAVELLTAVLERQTKKLFILCLVIFIAFVASNAYWIWERHQYEQVVTETYSAETDDGGTAIVNGDGSVNLYGESDLHKDN